MAPRIMIREDEDVSAYARKALEADGVAVLTGHKALRCEMDGELKFPSSPGRKSASASTCSCARWAAWRGSRASVWKSWAFR